jgi:hypothetical protein
MKQTAVEWLAEQLFGSLGIELTEHQSKMANEIFFKQAKEMESQQQCYSEEDLMESFIDGYKFRAEASNLIFDNASRMYAIHIFNENFKNK